MNSVAHKTHNTMDVKEILTILPHRYPFLLVDKILSWDLEKGVIVGQKNATFNENFFQGHFPGAPIMPGVLLIEALAQVGGVLVHLKMRTDKVAVLLNVNHAKFRRPVKPGDVILLECKEKHFSLKAGKVHATATVHGKVVVEAELAFALVDKNLI